MTKYCPKCKITKLEEQNYCTDCGVKLTIVEDCECGQYIYHADKFCPKCGKERSCDTK